MKKCPYCAGDIQGDAAVCSHCGVDLSQPGMTVDPFTRKDGAKARTVLLLLGGFLVLGLAALFMFIWFVNPHQIKTSILARMQGKPRIESDCRKSLDMIDGAELPDLVDYAEEYYEDSEFFIPGTIHYTVEFGSSETIVVSYGWCAKDQDTLMENLASMDAELVLDGEIIPNERLCDLHWDFPVGDEYFTDGAACAVKFMVTSSWPRGEHVVTTTWRVNEKIFDGFDDVGVGDYITEYKITVR